MGALRRPGIAARAPRLTIATVATATPMGAQSYQEHVAERAAETLHNVTGDQWRVHRTVARSMRSSLAGNRRAPIGALTRAGPGARRAFGRTLYGRTDLVHRMNLELPPPAAGDVITLHDVVSWRFPDESAPVRAAAEELRRADGVICVSAFTASEAVDLLGVPDPIVIHNGVDERFFDASPLSPADRQRLGVPDRYVLHAGGASARKNLQALAQAWPRVSAERPDLWLVLAGPPHPQRTALFTGLPRVVLAGRLDDAAMPGLVAGAAAVVVPSLYEGFGLPVLEAMAARVSVVFAATSSLPEVAGDAGLAVEPTAEGIADGLLTATGADPALARLIQAGRLRAAEFTWDRCVREHAGIWRSVAGR